MLALQMLLVCVFGSLSLTGDWCYVDFDFSIDSSQSGALVLTNSDLLSDTVSN